MRLLGSSFLQRPRQVSSRAVLKLAPGAAQHPGSRDGGFRWSAMACEPGSSAAPRRQESVRT